MQFAARFYLRAQDFRFSFLVFSPLRCRSLIDLRPALVGGWCWFFLFDFGARPVGPFSPGRHRFQAQRPVSCIAGFRFPRGVRAGQRQRTRFSAADFSCCALRQIFVSRHERQLVSLLVI
jgi:hypothetical protein